VADGLRGSSHEKRQSEAESCMELGKRAVAVKPGGVEGNFYGANGAGQYSQEIGILKALGKGMEGIFNGFIDKAIQIDPTFEAGGPYVVKGRYYYELPWPKRSYSKSAEMYHKALGVQPQNVRAQVYLAETLLADGDAKGAKVQVDAALAHTVGAYDPPEEARAMKFAAELKPKVDKELK
jgi:hypothetical protein